MTKKNTTKTNNANGADMVTEACHLHALLKSKYPQDSNKIKKTFPKHAIEYERPNSHSVQFISCYRCIVTMKQTKLALLNNCRENFHIT